MVFPEWVVLPEAVVPNRFTEFQLVSLKMSLDHFGQCNGRAENSLSYSSDLYAVTVNVMSMTLAWMKLLGCVLPQSPVCAVQSFTDTYIDKYVPHWHVTCFHTHGNCPKSVFWSPNLLPQLVHRSCTRWSIWCTVLSKSSPFKGCLSPKAA